MSLTANTDPSWKVLNPISSQVWEAFQMEYYGNPVYAKEGIRLGRAFLEFFYPSERGEIFNKVATVLSNEAVILIVEHFVDWNSKQTREQAVAELMKKFDKGDPSATENVRILGSDGRPLKREKE